MQFTSNKKPEEPQLNVLLASQSAGRRMLLEKLGVWFNVVVPHVDEENIIHPNPAKMIELRAKAKVDELINHPHVYALSEENKYLIIAADSMAVIGKKTFGKVKNVDEAREMLKNLMGRTHVFITAINIVLLEFGKLKKRWDKKMETKVTLRKMSKQEVESYLGKYKLEKYAACYALNETPWDLVIKIDGSYTNVIGLPFEPLLPILRSMKLVV